MKHLKKFNESTMLPDVNNINDILLDIIDLDYLCRITTDWWADERPNCIDVTIYGKKEEFDIEQNLVGQYIYLDINMLDTIERLVVYLKGEGYETKPNSKKILEFIRKIGTRTEEKIPNKVFEITIGQGYIIKY